MKSFITVLSLPILVHGAANKVGMRISSNVEFPRKVDPDRYNTPIIQGKNFVIDRILKQQGNTTFYSSPYSIGMEDMNKNWRNVQMAWHLLGFYIDCTYNSDYESDNYQKRVLHDEHQQKEGQEHTKEEKDHRDDHHEEEHKADHKEDNEEDGNKNCTRKVMYAVVCMFKGTQKVLSAIFLAQRNSLSSVIIV
jgi:hypothetical protein